MDRDDLSSRVQRQVDRLRRKNFRSLEAEVTRKRVAWHRNAKLTSHAHSSPRQAFELFCLRYLGLPEDQVPVLSATDTEISWLSVNPCPTLDACRELGLDTRTVCRAVYEKPTQMFLSQIDPQLRFLRDYDEIRPHSHHCREKIVRLDFEQMMRVAIREARASLAEGNKGYGAVVVYGNQILAKAHDTAMTRQDPSLHAELEAIRRAVQASGDTNLCGSILFSTCEPCPMCASLAVWTNVTSVVYGASIEETFRMGRSRIRVSCREIVEKSPATIEIIGDILGNECRDLYFEGA